MPATPTILDRLRQATAVAHQRLEEQLDLLRPPPCRHHLNGVLHGFHRFHAAWEPKVEAMLGAAFVPRRRLHLLQADRAAFGMDKAPAPPLALNLFSTPAGAWGSLYVMEGSTLGGAIIAKTLAGMDGPAPSGIGYFSPYGRRTAAMWRSFRSDLLQVSRPETDADMIDAACRTFACLTTLLPARPALPRP